MQGGAEQPVGRVACREEPDQPAGMQASAGGLGTPAGGGLVRGKADYYGWLGAGQVLGYVQDRTIETCPLQAWAAVCRGRDIPSLVGDSCPCCGCEYAGELRRYGVAEAGS